MFKKSDNIKIVKEGKCIIPGDKFDKVKAVSPYVIRQDNNYIMYYVGTSCDPEKRDGYKILRATSIDGLNFKKNNSAILSKLFSKKVKEYSPCVVREGNKWKIYFASNNSGEYGIHSSYSNDGINFLEENKLIIKSNNEFIRHSPRIVKLNNKVYCFYTVAKNNKKIFSKRYPKFDFANGFSIYCSTSSDGSRFSNEKKVIFHNLNIKYINYYGHSVIYDNNLWYMAVTIFDGSINRISLFTSVDGINFYLKTLLVAPDEVKEIGCYSSSICKITDTCFRLYYGVRYFDNHWGISSLKFYII